MSEELVTKVQEMLKEETWTRAAISNYTQNNLIELESLVESIISDGSIDEVKAICDEQLSHAKDSIIALYISGMLSLQKGALDNSSLETLTDIFQKNHKDNIVEKLCQYITARDATNRFALRTLAAYYREHDSDEQWALYETLVKIDFEEADVAKLLGGHYENSNPDLAKEYYKKALLRYVNAKNYTSVREVWAKLVAMIPEEIDFFLMVQRKIAKNIGEDKSALLMDDLCKYYMDNQKWDTAISILKLILSIDPKDSAARRNITECYQKKYADHSNVDEYIRSSNLNQSFRNVFEAINDFEKHIAFDVNHFVYHRTWHVGVITKVVNGMLSINFGAKVGVKEISLKMAVDALQPLADDHIWVIKATQSIPGDPDFAALKAGKGASKEEKAKIAKQKRELLIKKIKDDKTWALKTIIRSFDNSCDLKKIKAELVNTVQKKGEKDKKELGLLTSGEWTSWSSAAKKILESDATFCVNKNNNNEYVVRDHEVTQSEKLNNEFTAEKGFFKRIDILMRYVNDPAAEKESDFFADMFSYFTGYVKSFVTTNDANDQVVASYLVVQKIISQYPSLTPATRYTFDRLYRRIENPRAMYLELKDTKNTSLREDYLNNIKTLPDWVDQYIMLFPTVLEKKMLDTLIAENHVDKVKALLATAFDDFRGYRNAILYFFENSRNEDWFKEVDIPLQKQLIALLNIIAHAYREINSHVNSTENKKIIKNAEKLLFDDGTLINFMLESPESVMTHMYTLVDDIADLDGSKKALLRNKILEKYPDYKFPKAEERSVAPKGMLVTQAKKVEKEAELKDLSEVQIPQNAQEVSEARAKGDLKENAEYQAAKEHQHYLNKKLAQLQGELARAVIFDPTTATTSYISFGTLVTLLNKDTNKEEKYTILGPWESDTDNGVISYMSPFGNELLDHKVGEDLDFEINGHAYKFNVKSIKLAKI